MERCLETSNVPKASFTSLPFELHELIFSYVRAPRYKFFTQDGVGLFGLRRKKWLGSSSPTKLSMICKAWRTLAQSEVYAHLNLPHALTTAEEDVYDLRRLIIRNPDLGTYITSININGPAGEQATLDLWQNLFALLSKIDRKS